MKTNLSEAINNYLVWKSTHTQRAYINYKPWLLKFAAAIEHKPIEDITIDDVVRFRLLMDNKYQPVTIQLAMVAVHNFLKWCNLMKYDTISSGLIRIPRSQARPRPVVFIEDYDKMLAFYKGKTDFISMRNQLIVRLLWDTGVRISELCDLNVDTVDLEKREATIRTRKSYKMRQIFWTVETNAFLIEYLKKRTTLSVLPALLVGIGREGRLKPRSIQRVLVKLSKDLSLGKTITPHSFRHGKAHHILNMGGNPKHIQTVLGHSELNPIAAYHYTQLNDIEHKSVCRRFLIEGVQYDKQNIQTLQLLGGSAQNATSTANDALSLSSSQESPQTGQTNLS